MDRRQRLRAVAMGACAVLAFSAAVVVARDAAVPAGGGGDASAAEATSEVEAAAPPVITITPRGNAAGVFPRDAVQVTATSGSLSDVALVNEAGVAVRGAMAPDARTWSPAEPLGYGKTYTLQATGRGSGGTTDSERATFTTVTPSHQTDVALTTTSGASLVEGNSYGVGTVIVARFDDAVRDRAAAEKSLRVTTSPAVEGSWTWVDDTTAHWRPREYYPANTEVTVEAGIYGVDLGEGTFGASDKAVRFRIGNSRVTIVDDKTKQVNVFQDGTLIKSMPTSMGRGGTETVNGKTIAFWTQPGTYTVMDKANPVIMDSSTYGLPVDSSSGYRVSVAYATRISPDGIYLHEREATVWAQGNTNVSAGCLNLSEANAKWFYDFAQPGDIVEIRNTGGEPLQQWQNGDWSVPWDTWLRGSALSR